MLPADEATILFVEPIVACGEVSVALRVPGSEVPDEQLLGANVVTVKEHRISSAPLDHTVGLDL
jgi:hypothetical protein